MSELYKFQPDILHCHDISTLPAGTAYKLDNNCKLVYDAHEIYEATASVKPNQAKIYERILKSSAKLLDGFITVNDMIANYYEQKYPEIPKPIILYNSAKLIQPQTQKHKNLIRSKLGIENNKKILLYQGAYSPKRGLEEVVKSAKDFPPNWVLVLMGWGSLERELKGIATSNQTLNSKVYFLPKASQDELDVWTSSADCGLIPYLNSCLNHQYCSPNKLWEYPRSGLPVIASDLDFMRKIINKHQYGWLVDDFRKLNQLPNLLKNMDDTDFEIKRNNTITFFKNNHWDNIVDPLFLLYSPWSTQKKI
jgi:glycosyltransferase involved in cell wall biosynthesis